MPTFGNTNVEDEYHWDQTGIITGDKFALTEEGTIQSIHFYAYEGTGNMRLAIYDDDAGAPNALQCETNSEAISTGWNQLTPTTTPTLPAGDYWLCYQFDSATPNIALTPGAANQQYEEDQAYGAFPATASPDRYWAYYDSIYATYAVPIVGGFAYVF